MTNIIYTLMPPGYTLQAINSLRRHSSTVDQRQTGNIISPLAS